MAVDGLLGEALRNHQAGRLAEAQRLYRQVLEAEPENADGLHLMGQLARQIGRPDLAIELISRAVAIGDTVPRFHAGLGAALKEVGRLDEAAAAYRKAVDLAPDDDESLHGLANVLQMAGRLAEAVPVYRRALVLRPDAADVHNNLGNALIDLGQAEEAVAAYRRAIALAPEMAEAHNNLGTALRETGHAEEALACYDRAIALRPDYAQAFSNQGNALAELGRMDEAIAAHRRAIDLRPDFAPGLNNLGAAMHQAGRQDEAVPVLRRSLELAPDAAAAWCGLGVALKDIGRPDEGLAAVRRAIALEPDNAIAHDNQAHLLMDLGLVGEAEAAFRRAIALAPDQIEAYSGLLMALNFRAGVAPQTIFAEARRFAAQLELLAPSPTFVNSRAPDRRLRIGYVSGDFRRHPVGYFLTPVLRCHDPAAVECFCYDNALRPDEVTTRLQGLGHHWRAIARMPDAEAATLIAADGIDILVDLSGHTAANRLRLFARKPAPVQVTWLGYWGTTGLSAIDYLLADAATPVPADEAWYSERIMRLPGGRFCYEPPEYAPSPPAAPPQSRLGRTTFGSFNNLAKLGPDAIELWAAILRAVPEACLLLKWKTLNDPAARQLLLDRFSAAGVAAERLELRGPSMHPRMLEEYGDIDIALDPFPFSGGLTSCEALWMGVPVVTLVGATPPARQTAAFLEALGLDDLIADTPDRYVAIAVALAADSGRIERLRAELRPRMAASPLCQAKAFTRNLEDAYRRMWKAWCASAA